MDSRTGDALRCSTSSTDTLRTRHTSASKDARVSRPYFFPSSTLLGQTSSPTSSSVDGLVMFSSREPHQGADHAARGYSKPRDYISDDDTSGVLTISAATQADDAVEKVIQHDTTTSAKLLTAGALAGAISKTATAPLARITILSQVQGASTTASKGVTSVRSLGVTEALRTIIRREGFRALWKGNGVTLVHRLPYSASNFYIYEQCRKLFRDQRTKTAEASPSSSSSNQDIGFLRNMSERLASGAMAGSCAVTLAYPLDLVRTRLAVQGEHRYYKGIIHALQTIVRDEGARGLYRGLGATVIGTGPNIALNYCLYETFKTVACKLTQSKNDPDARPSVMISLACGSLSGVCSTTVTFPLDLVRRRIQMMPSAVPSSTSLSNSPSKVLAARAPHVNYWAMIAKIHKTEGVRGFYHGIRPEYLKVVPGVAIAFGTYELLKRAMGVDTNL